MQILYFWKGTNVINYKEDCKRCRYLSVLRKCVGWVELDKKQAQTALNNSLKIVTVFDDENQLNG